MDIDNLQDEEVLKIIQILKHPKNQLSFQEAYNKVAILFGKVDIQEPIVDYYDDLEMILNVYRGKIEDTKYSIHLRFKEYHHHLVRIDINPSNIHINTNGKKIIGSHIHIYSNQSESKDSIAIPIEESNFPLVDDLLDAFYKFLDYTNIRKKGDDHGKN